MVIIISMLNAVKASYIIQKLESPDCYGKHCISLGGFLCCYKHKELLFQNKVGGGDKALKK